MARAAGLTAALRSAGLPPSQGDAVYVADVLGELGLWYRLTGIACIGGSLVPVGGHNPIEAAQLGCALLYGPHMFTVAGVAAELQAGERRSGRRGCRDIGRRAIGRLLADRPAALGDGGDGARHRRA